MRKPLIMVVDDAGDRCVHDVKMALAKEHHERTTAMHILMEQGHVTVMEDMDPAHIRVRVGDEFFSDERDKFPSTQLLARVQLAIHAGNSDRERRLKEEVETHLTDAMRYGMSLHNLIPRRPVGKSELLGMGYHRVPGDYLYEEQPMPWAEAMEVAHHNTATITRSVTATVKTKGLRP